MTCTRKIETDMQSSLPTGRMEHFQTQNIYVYNYKTIEYFKTNFQ
jgi:hypothetical protein